MDSESGIVEVVLGTGVLTIIAPLATFTGIHALEMHSEGRIVEVVLGTEFQTMTDDSTIDVPVERHCNSITILLLFFQIINQQAIIKLGLRQFARKVGERTSSIVKVYTERNNLHLELIRHNKY